MKGNLSLCGLTGIFLISGVAFGAQWEMDAPPPCMANGQQLQVNDAQVVQYETSTPNNFLARAYVAGPVVEVFPDHSGHNHFAIQIGNGAYLEVVYNQSFGELPEIQVGMQVVACGDYITANAQSGPYPPSPAGAIIHWVHVNPQGYGHDNGFLIINDVLYGQDPNGHGA